MSSWNMAITGTNYVLLPNGARPAAGTKFKKRLEISSSKSLRILTNPYHLHRSDDVINAMRDPRKYRCTLNVRDSTSYISDHHAAWFINYFAQKPSQECMSALRRCHMSVAVPPITRQLDRLFSNFFTLATKKISKLCVIGRFPTPRASSVENVSL